MLSMAFFLTVIFAAAQPTVTSFSPTAGVPGSTVVITGTNFNTTAGNNAVFFNGARGAVTAASTTQLTVTVPAGARSGFIDVVNLGTFRQVKSRVQFIVRFNGGTFGASSLNAPVNFATNGAPNKIDLADMDGDGKLDILVNRTSSTIGILRNNTTTATPSFAAVTAWGNTSGATDFSVGDLNSDGKLDTYQTGIAAGLAQQGYVLPNNSTVGTLAAGTAVLAGGLNNNQLMRGSAIADISSPADGKPDAIWNFETSGGINNSYLYTNVNTGASPALNFATNVVLINSGGFSRMWAPAAADFDGDGLNDVATYESNTTRNLLVSRNTAGAGFTNTYFTLNLGINSPQAGKIYVYDVDVDGKPDIILMYGANLCRIYRNTSTPGTLGFTLAGDFGASVANKSYFTMGDVTGDGKLDLVFACNDVTASIAVMPNITSGTNIGFGTPITFSGQAFTDVAVGDVNADGKPDIVAINGANASASVYINNTAAVPVPTITNFNPASGAVGTSVTITGTNFTGATAVSFNNINATAYTVNSATQITATVPATATTGAIRVVTAGGTATSASNFTVTSALPTLTSRAPANVGTGQTLTISGTNFTNVTDVTCGGISVGAANITVNSTTQITVTVPVVWPLGGGILQVITQAGASNTLLVNVQQIVSSFTPTSGPAGTTITVNGNRFSTVHFVAVAGNSTSFTVINDNQLTMVIPTNATLGPKNIEIWTPNGSQHIASTQFTVGNIPPTISSVVGPYAAAPNFVFINKSITINGSNFTGASAVTIGNGNTPVTNFTVVSATQITALISGSTPTGSGPVRVTTPGGTAASGNVPIVDGSPVISFFTPTTGAGGTQVSIQGTNIFIDAGSPNPTVTIGANNTPASFVSYSGNTVVVNAGVGTNTGPIRITTTYGTTTSSTNFTVAAPTTPTITGLSSNVVQTDFPVNISGTNLANPTSITCGGVALPLANITFSQADVIGIIIPANWPIGTNNIVVANANGTSNAYPITITQAITTYSPAGGAFAGYTVGIIGNRLATTNAVTIGGQAASFTVVNDTRINVVVPNFAVLGDKTVIVSTPLGGTVQSFLPLRVFATTGPIITSFSPTQGPVGTVVTIDGVNLGTVNSVRIGDVTLPNNTFTIVSSTRLTAIVPPGATSGAFVGVTNTTTGTISDNTFAVTVTPAPAISSFTPSSGPVGTIVTITGTNFTGATAVSFNNVNASSFTVNSATQITATVPASATTGAIRVVTAGGAATSTSNFAVSSALPTVSSISQLSAPAGTSITITGTNLSNASVGVSFSSFNVLANTNTSITVQVPANAYSGPLQITTLAGSVTAGFFTFQTASNVLQHRSGQVLTLTGPAAASSYQWQVDLGNGNGFVNLSNAGVYSGVTTQTLVVNGLTTGATGYRYRVTINGNSPQTARTLRFVTYARTNGQWNNASTWEGGLVPDLNTDVIVDDANITVTANASVRILTVTNGGRVQVQPGVNFTVRQ